MPRIYLTIASLIAVATLAACSKEPPAPPAPDPNEVFKTVGEQRSQGRANAALVAAEYQRQNPRVQGWEAIVKADSFHSATCPQGDGWAEVVFMRTNRSEGSTKNLEVEKFTVMCSTVSFAEGCVAADPKANNWDKHPKKSMDNKCNPLSEVPMPLPKVVAEKL